MRWSSMADDLPRLFLSEAASRSGLHREALRARAKRGHLPSRRGNLGQVLVQLPPELLTSAQGVTQDSAQGRVEHLAEVVHDLEQELSEARERLAKAEAKVEAVTALVHPHRTACASGCCSASAGHASTHLR